MNNAYHGYTNREVHDKAHSAYYKLVQWHSDAGLEEFLGYMGQLGYEHDASNNQLTFWQRGARSPLRARIIFELAGPQDPMIVKTATAVTKTAYYVCYYFAPEAVLELQKELEDAPDVMAQARKDLTDRANDQNPALRQRPISTRIAS
jgi:hypothetical protein